MKSSNFILKDYLGRIGFNGEPKVDIDTLTKLMKCQLTSIPFENIDVQVKKHVSLEPEDIVNKIVYSRRGGYCYEVNGLFAMALESIGFSYIFCGARPMFYPSLRPKTHVVIVVNLHDEKWICDLGFGSYGIRAPISLSALDITIQQDYDQFMLSKPDQATYLIKARIEGDWKNQFCFDLYQLNWIDLALPNYFNSTNPDTIFVKKLVVIRFTPDGRIVLFGNEIRRHSKEQLQIAFVENHDLADLLENEFSIELPELSPNFFNNYQH